MADETPTRWPHSRQLENKIIARTLEQLAEEIRREHALDDPSAEEVMRAVGATLAESRCLCAELSAAYSIPNHPLHGRESKCLACDGFVFALPDHKNGSWRVHVPLPEGEERNDGIAVMSACFALRKAGEGRCSWGPGPKHGRCDAEEESTRSEYLARALMLGATSFEQAVALCDGDHDVLARTFPHAPRAMIRARLRDRHLSTVGQPRVLRAAADSGMFVIADWDLDVTARCAPTERHLRYDPSAPREVFVAVAEPLVAAWRAAHRAEPRRPMVEPAPSAEVHDLIERVLGETLDELDWEGSTMNGDQGRRMLAKEHGLVGFRCSWLLREQQALGLSRLDCVRAFLDAVDAVAKVSDLVAVGRAVALARGVLDEEISYEDALGTAEAEPDEIEWISMGLVCLVHDAPTAASIGFESAIRFVISGLPDALGDRAQAVLPRLPYQLAEAVERVVAGRQLLLPAGNNYIPPSGW